MICWKGRRVDLVMGRSLCGWMGYDDDDMGEGGRSLYIDGSHGWRYMLGW